MDLKNKKLLHILLIVIVILIVVLAITLGIVYGTKKNKNSNEEDIINSYDNTDELIEKYPIEYPTKVTTDLEKKIQNRLLTGFENWNRGFKAWKAWGNILYTSDSIYNVHGARLTLAHYQQAMDITLKQTKIMMGAFHNMLICGEFSAIHYDIITYHGDTPISGTVMEFVKFKDYGGKLGTRVVEGWGGPKDKSYDSMIKFQDEERVVQEQQDEYMLKYDIPETDSLKEKYPIIYETTYIDDNAEDILNIILKGFDSWNQGIENYIAWLDEGYDENASSYGTDKTKRDMATFKEEMRALAKKEKITKLYFDNILIRDNWAALHYRYRSENLDTKELYVGDRMQFLKFEQKESGLKIISSWVK